MILLCIVLPEELLLVLLLTGLWIEFLFAGVLNMPELLLTLLLFTLPELLLLIIVEFTPWDALLLLYDGLVLILGLL